MLKFENKTAGVSDILNHLTECNDNFIPPLSLKVNLDEYSRKIFDKAVTFEAWDDRRLVGLVAAYLNDVETGTGFVTSVSVVKDFTGQGIASRLMVACIEYAKQRQFKQLKLEVNQRTESAIKIYQKLGFVETETKGDSVFMSLDLR